MELKKALEKASWFDDSITEQIPEQEQDLKEAAKLLYEIANESTRYAYNVLELETNGTTRGISSIYHDCADQIKRALQGGDKTAFLAMSILEDAYTKIRRLAVTRLESILDGSSDMIANARRLDKILKNNPYRAHWLMTSEKYKSLIEAVGLPADQSDYSDLTAIADPLIDALTFYDRPRIEPIRRFSLGPAGDLSVPPAFARYVPVFRSETDLVRSVMDCGKQNVVLFAGLELTYADTENYFDAWYNGYNNERMTNVMRNKGITKEEYLSSIDPYSRVIYLCVKTGGILYLVKMPYQRESYSGSEFNDENKYCYGHRAGYAPYQAFYDTPPAAQEDTDFLALPYKGFPLSKLMDDEQKAWLPAFLNKTWDYFFKNGPVENAVDAYLPEERALILPEKAAEAAPGAGAVAVQQSKIAKCRLQIQIPSPEDLFDQPYLKRLVQAFDITPADLAKYEKLITMGPATHKLDVDQRLRRTAFRLVCEHAEDALSNLGAAKTQIHMLLADQEAAIRRILSGDCDAFTEIIVSGENGAKTSVTDTYRTPHLRVFWYGPAVKSAPPVLYRIRPKTSEDYAALLGVPVQDLKRPLDIYTELQQLWGNHQASGLSMPRRMSWDRTLMPSNLCNINLCMGRKAYKQIRTE